MINPLNITQLGELINKSLPKDKIIVKGEVSQPKNFRGNLYLSLKDNFCNIKSIIWKNKLESFKSKIEEGDKITVEGSLDFYLANGSVSFVIHKLVNHEGEGELFTLYQKIKDEFTKKGYFDTKHKAIKPTIINNILLITSENGAAIQDFIYTIDNNKSKLNYDLVDVPVQGTKCPNDIINHLNKDDPEYFNKYDIIVITRGGGSFEDLFGFSKPELIECVYKFNKPVLSAIGHMVDTSLLDLVSDYSTPTPSLAAQYIIDINKQYVSEIEQKRENIKRQLTFSFNSYIRKLKDIDDKILTFMYSFDKIKKNAYDKLVNILNKNILCLSKLDSNIDMKISTLELQKKAFIQIKKNAVEHLSSILNKKILFLTQIDSKINLKLNSLEIQKKQFIQTKQTTYDKFISMLNKKILFLTKLESNIDLKINTLELQKKSNEKNVVMISDKNNFDTIIRNSTDMNIILKNGEFYMSVINATDKRQIFKIFDYKFLMVPS